MSVEIKSENVEVGGSTVLLVSVKNGESGIGVYSAGQSPTGDSSMVNKTFYIGSEPVISICCPNLGSSSSDKLMCFSPSFQGIDNKLYDAFTNSFNRLNKGESLENGLKEIFSLLTDGVYTVYVSDYYTTDGSGSFFWGAYNIMHEIHGTAESNHSIGDHPYRPCFLIPSEPLDLFSSRMKVSTDEATKSRKIQGIAYHLSGLHSVLLKGHHGAASCTENNIPFKCAVIERVGYPYTEACIAPTVLTETEPDTSAEQPEAEKPTPPPPVPVERDGITGFRSASVKLPLEKIPKDMLRQILESRNEAKPPHFKTILQKSKALRRKSVSNNVIPRPVLDNCELMPDYEMVESAYAVDELSDAQLNALLSGETAFNGRIIISANFYSSIVTACNFLQFNNIQRFISFSISILENPDLNATHEYIARRMARLVSNEKVYRFFKDVLAGSDTKYEKILTVAEKYVTEYELNKLGK